MLLGIFLLVSYGLATVVETPYGKVRGFDFKTFSGKDVEVFLGIPYAKPPVGELRFEQPQITDKWGDEISATKWGPSCYVHHRLNLENKTYSEDCLTLNVITPKDRKGEEKLPVFVFIHGGGFVFGDALMLGYRHASENFVAKGNIIFISLQYRLGFLGFMTDGRSTLPGNLGMWDQALALKFIKEIIPAFGGDPEQITIAGQSAGSASCSAMIISPHANTYFKQAVQLSGSLYASWAYSENVIEVSTKLSKAVNCDFEDQSNFKACLKDLSVEDLYNGMDIVGNTRYHPGFMLFQPHFDGDFFPEPIDVLWDKAPKKKIMQGSTDDESTLFTLVIETRGDDGFYIPEDKRTTFGKSDLNEFIAKITPASDFREEHKKVQQLILEHYLPKDGVSYLQAYSDILSDLQFSLPVYQEAQQKIKNGWELFYYVMQHSRSKHFNPSSIVNGTMHGDEVPFILELWGLEDMPLRPEDEKFKENMLNTIIAFIKTGSPSTSEIIWKAATKEDSDLHLTLAPKAELTNHYARKESATFWLETLPAMVGQENLRKAFLPGLRLSNAAKTEL